MSNISYRFETIDGTDFKVVFTLPLEGKITRYIIEKAAQAIGYDQKTIIAKCLGKELELPQTTHGAITGLVNSYIKSVMADIKKDGYVIVSWKVTNVFYIFELNESDRRIKVVVKGRYAKN